MTWTRRLQSAALAATCLATLATPNPAAAGKPVLLVHPTKVLLEGRIRGASVNLINRGDAKGTFLISWIDYDMTPEGGLIVRDAETPPSLQPHVRLSPRRVTLEPGGRQVVKLALRPGPDIREGEYYSHLKILAVPSPETAAAGAALARATASGVRITARTAMAIPVVWRNGRSRPRAEILDARLDRDAGSVSVDLRRLGSSSVRGSLSLLPPGRVRRDDPILAEVLPVVIYPNLDARTVELRLTAIGLGEALKPGTRLVYSSEPDARGRKTTLASFSITE